MAITYSTDLTQISSADTTSAGGTWSRTGSTQNPTADTKSAVEGAGAIAFKTAASTGTTDTGSTLVLTNTFDATNKVFYHWRNFTTGPNMETKANLGISLFMSPDTSYAKNNYKQWALDGNDTDILGGWRSYAVDPNLAATASLGNWNLAAIKTVAFLHRQLTAVGTIIPNAFMDAMFLGTGHTVTASSAGDTINFSGLQLWDNDSTRAYGVVTTVTGIYFITGKITIGATGQTNATLFKDTNKTVVYKQQIVADTFYTFSALGAAGNITTVQFGNKDGSNNTSAGCTITGEGTARWSMVMNTNTRLLAYSTSLFNALAITLTSTSELRNTSLSNCGTTTVAGATIIGCQFISPSATAISGTVSELSSVSNSSFTSAGTGHAIEITGTASNITLTNITFNGYAGSDGSTGNEAIFVNIPTGSMNITVSGGSTPTIRTAGASVTVVSGAVSVTAKAVTEDGTNLQNAVVHIEAAAGGPFPVGASVTIVNSGTTATVTHTSHGLATNDQVVIRGASLLQNLGVFSITVTGANTYTYTMGSAPGSSPTGTITSTFVVLNGNTNASGEITMSRVFPSNQPVVGRIRKASSAPYYKNASIVGTVSSATGATFTGIMISDD